MIWLLYKYIALLEWLGYDEHSYKCTRCGRTIESKYWEAHERMCWGEEEE